MNTISNLRLLAAIVSIINIIFIFTTNINYTSLIISAVSIIFFISLVRIHSKLNEMFKKVIILRNLNSNSIKRLDGRWSDFEDDGCEFLDENHNYSYDIDVFGRGSLFQWMNLSKTQKGRLKLASILTNEPFDIKDIENRQETIKELSKRLWWRQKLHMECETLYSNNCEEEELIKWSKARNKFYSRSYIILGIRLMPFITIALLILAFGLGNISPYIPIALFFIQAAVIFIGISKRSKQLDLVYKYRNRLQGYTKVLCHIEKGEFNATYLNKLKTSLVDNSGENTIIRLKQLEVLVERILNRNNAMFIPFNILFLWDYQCLIGLEQWKEKHGSLIEGWIQVIGEVEALSSLANIGYDYPKWVFPSITPKSSILYGKSIGHPLLTNKRINNDIDIEDPSRILLITGSNMSGKSTFLRTIGVNLILAYAGAPVCAKYMRCSIMSIYTCIRINDNLEKGISSFYSELLKIKSIVEATKEDRQVFFMLDEIFKGTNSHDRHLGAKYLIKQLYKNKAIGLVSTHDLELGVLEKESDGKIRNYHFQESYENNEISFDYILRSGISTTRNAMYLMKMAGVEVEDI